MTVCNAAFHLSRYTVVGIVCMISNTIMLVLGDLVGVNYVLTLIVAFVLVTPLGYVLHSNFTFKEPMSIARFLHFSSGVAAGFPISLALLALFYSFLHLPMIVASLLTAAILFVWNYALAHWAIRRRWKL